MFSQSVVHSTWKIYSICCCEHPFMEQVPKWLLLFFEVSSEVLMGAYEVLYSKCKRKGFKIRNLRPILF